MKHYSNTVVVFVLSSLLVGTAAATSNLQGCVEPGAFDPDLDYFPDKFTPKDALYKGPPADFFPGKFVPHETTDFLTISYHNSYKIVTNKFHNQTYLLYQCGTTPPAQELDGRHHLVLPVPHSGGIAITQTPQIPPMELLGKRREIIAYIGNPQYVSSPCMNYMMETEGTIQLYFDPDDPFNTTITAGFKQDFVTAHPDALILEGPLGDRDGARALSLAASQERTNVATFDWIGLFGALFNLEAEANRIAADTLERYECSSSNAAQLSADVPATQQRPTVLWAQYFNGYGWSVAECTTWQETYYCEYAKHCGADILSRPEHVGSSPEGPLNGLYFYVSDEELLELGRDADVWIYASQTWDAVYKEKKELMDQFKAVQNRQVYDTQGQGPNSWYEQRLAEYEVVALDFCDIVGNANPGYQHVRRWLRNIYTDPIGSLEECRIPNEIDEPYVPASAECLPLSNSNPSSTTTTTSSTTSMRWSMVGLAAAVASVALLVAT